MKKMKKLLDNLKEAIKNYENCVDVEDVDEFIMLENIQILSRCCREVDKECFDIFNKVFYGK